MPKAAVAYRPIGMQDRQPLTPQIIQHVCYEPVAHRRYDAATATTTTRRGQGVPEVKGGFKLYRGSGAAARNYVEADHQAHRADDYYLREGAGIAEMSSIGRDGTVLDRMSLDGDRYEEWVEGVDVRSGEPKGAIRRGITAIERPPLRFAEVIVNGPKSWSLAAKLHPDIAAAYEAAQDRAVEQISGYVAVHASTRVGPRGAQVQMPAAAVEVAAVRHYTSRAGDPHRHIHLQFNARVVAEDGTWRGIDSAALLKMQRAVNGIGHRAVTADPAFRQALADHGYTLNSDGEIRELAAVVPAMSKRSAQVAANVDRYEREWREEKPGEEPSRELRRAWDQRAWADGREAKKLVPVEGGQLEEGWVRELRGLGVDVDAEYRRASRVIPAVRVGAIDRDAAAERVLAVLGAGARGRSTWNVYDVRGVTEEVLTALDVVGDRASLDDLAEDISARVEGKSLSVLERSTVPEHVRHLTSAAVIARQEDIEGRMAVRALSEAQPASLQRVAAAQAALDRETLLDAGQVDAVRAIAGTGQLVLIEGAAGAGKTSVLATAREALAASGERTVVVAPTKKAAQVAAAEIGAQADTAAALVHQYGYRWDTEGVWNRLTVGDVDASDGTYSGPHETSRLHAGDVLIVDEAGMLDQDTARALLTVADEAGARVVMVGDRRQLPAVGIGGVVDLAAKWIPQSSHVELIDVHRFQRTIHHDDGSNTIQRDDDFAELSLQIRSGEDPAKMFDRLVERGEVRLHDSEADALGELAWQTARRQLNGTQQVVSVATNDTAALINEAVREQLVSAGTVDDQRVVRGSDGLRIGAGDRVMTRHNDRDTGVANRQTWTVTSVNQDGSITLQNAATNRDTNSYQPAATVDAAYVTEHVHLAYASTVHGVQGETVDVGDVLASDHSDGASIYVGLTRGRYARTLHLIGDHDTARDTYIQISTRSRADLGLDAARQAATAEAEQYAEPQRYAEKGQAAMPREWVVSDAVPDFVRRRETSQPVQPVVAVETADRDLIAQLAAELNNAAHSSPDADATADADDDERWDEGPCDDDVHRHHQNAQNQQYGPRW